jgi:hypothetical protein
MKNVIKQKSMKHIIFFFFCASAHLFAQLPSNSYCLGGMGNYHTTTSDGGKSQAINADIVFGRSTAKNTLWGIKILSQANTNKYNIWIPEYFNGIAYSISKSSDFGIGLSPFVRYYFGQAKIQFFIQGNVNYTYRQIKKNYLTPTIFSTINGNHNVGISPGLGLSHLLSKNTALELSTYYTWNYAFSFKELRQGLDFKIGLLVFLEK